MIRDYNMKLAKHIITVLAFQIVTYATGFRIYKEDAISIIKRSPADHFPLFGLRPSFQVPSLFSGIPQPLNTLGHLLTPVPYRHNTQEKFRKPIEMSSMMKINFESYNNPDYLGTPGFHVDKNIETTSSNVLANLDERTQDIHHNNNNNKVENGKDNVDYTIKSTDTVDENVTNDEQNTKDDPTNKSTVIDKESINSIFNEILKSNVLDSTTTTEDSTLDYTTGTGDYESSTIDDLQIRIPSAAVATLLGR